MVFISGLADMTSVTLHGVTDTLSPQDEKVRMQFICSTIVFSSALRAAIFWAEPVLLKPGKHTGSSLVLGGRHSTVTP